MDDTELAKRFNHHPPREPAVADAHESVRAILSTAASDLHEAIEPVATEHGREFALVLTKLEEAMFWANAAIARNQDGTPAEDTGAHVG